MQPNGSAARELHLASRWSDTRRVCALQSLNDGESHLFPNAADGTTQSSLGLQSWVFSRSIRIRANGTKAGSTVYRPFSADGTPCVDADHVMVSPICNGAKTTITEPGRPAA